MRPYVALAAVFAAGCAGGPGEGDTIPWIPDRPPVVAPQALPPPCTPGDLESELVFQGATGGLLAGGVNVTKRAGGPCSLLGRPQVRLIDSPVPHDVAYGDHGGTPARALRQGERAWVRIFWSEWCVRRAARALELDLPRGGGTIRFNVVDKPGCPVPSSRTSLGVGRFRKRPPPSTLPLRPTVLGTDVRECKLRQVRCLHAVPGEPLRYRVRLVNVSKRPFRFGRCPNYAQNLIGVVRDRRVLNCRPVGTLDPGEGATFAMVLSIPQRASKQRTALTWVLAPGTTTRWFGDAPVVVDLPRSPR